MSERVFYPDTDDVSSTSKVVERSIARNRTRELILSGSTIQFAQDEFAVADASRGESLHTTQSTRRLTADHCSIKGLGADAAWDAALATE